MKYDEFIQRVQERAGIERIEAIQLVDAALETLGERLHHTERDRLAEELPRELRDLLNKRVEIDRYPLEEFYNRVGSRTEKRYSPAVTQTRAVMSVLQEGVSRSKIEEVRSQLPADYGELFGDEPQSPLSPTFDGG